MTKIIGHRGWRGRFPENSLIGFEQLALIGVNSVELDIIINKDKEIIVSHEPWFDKQYCLSQTKSNFYYLSTNEIQKIDCGTKNYLNFPYQRKFKSVKPKLSSVVELWDSLEVKPFIALEVKSETKLYGSYQPYAQEFAEILLAFEEKYLKTYDYFIQSFDPFFLKTYHEINPTRDTGLLIENENSVNKNLDMLNYLPTFYNPEHLLINDTLIEELNRLKVKTYTWTVNSKEEYDRLKPFNLEGIITDYPELFL